MPMVTAMFQNIPAIRRMLVWRMRALHSRPMIHGATAKMTLFPHPKIIAFK
jgi:hypothetical protein